MANINAFFAIPFTDLNDYLLEHQPVIRVTQSEWALYPCKHNLSKEDSDLVPQDELLELILDGQEGGIEDDYSIPLIRDSELHLFHIELIPASTGAKVEVLSLYFWVDYKMDQDIHRKAFEVTRRVSGKEISEGVGFGLSTKTKNVSQEDIDRIVGDINRLRAKTRMVEIVENSGHDSEIGSY